MRAFQGCRVLGEIRFTEKNIRKTLLEGVGLNYSDTKTDGERMLLMMYSFFAIKGPKPKLLSQLVRKIFTEGLNLNMVDEREEGTDIIFTVAGEVENIHDLRNIFVYLTNAGHEVFFVADFYKPADEGDLLLFSKRIEGGVSRLNVDTNMYGLNDVKMMSQGDLELLEGFLEGVPEYVKTILRIAPPKGCTHFLAKIDSLI